MEVTCEKCQTQYLVDDSKIKRSGMSVRCSECSHTFRVGSTIKTNPGLGTLSPDTKSGTKNDRAKISNTTPQTPPVTSNHSTEGSAWLVKSPSGEIQTFYSLQNLQQQIVLATISRLHTISKDGVTWKRLGDVKQLNTYFSLSNNTNPNKTIGSHYDEDTDARKKTIVVDTKHRQPLASHAWSGNVVPSQQDTPGHDFHPEATSELAKNSMTKKKKRKKQTVTSPLPWPAKIVGIVSIFVILGSFAVVFRILNPPNTSQPVQKGSLSVPFQIANNLDANTTDAGAPVTIIDSEIEFELHEAIGKSNIQALENILTMLESFPETPEVQIARARVYNSLIRRSDALQPFTTDKKKLRSLRNIRKKHIALSTKFLETILKKGTDPSATGLTQANMIHANVAMADLLELRDKPNNQVERFLDRLESPNLDAKLLRARLQMRDSDTLPEAIESLEELDSKGNVTRSGDIRPRWHLANAYLQNKNYVMAEESLLIVLQMSPEHEPSLQLLRHVKELAADFEALNPSEEVPVDAGTTTTEETAEQPTPVRTTYSELMTQAKQQKQIGRCPGAIYEQALDINPVGTNALSGLATCQLQQKKYSQAISNYRAALGLAARYPDAMWGLAEAYRLQGDTDNAVEAYKDYVAAHPNTPRASAAKQRMDKIAPKENPKAK